MKLVEHLSPNFATRPAGTPVDILLLHYTGMKSAEESLERLCDPASKVSAHYLIDEAGTVFRLVEEEMRAWHAGISYWAGETDINSCSIGIELQNPGHEWGYRPFPDAQMQGLRALARDVLARHPIPRTRVLAHSDVAPSRKQDPGELFDWRALAEAGIGLWPEPAGRRPAAAMTEAKARAALTAVGYDPGSPIADVLTAFQRRYRPACIDGRIDAETAALIEALAG